MFEWFLFGTVINNAATYKFSCELTLSVLLGRYLGMEFLCHVVARINFLRNRQVVLYSRLTFLYPHQPRTGSQFLHVLTNTCLLFFS